MTCDALLARFDGDAGRRRLVELLQQQVTLLGDATAAAEMAEVATLRELRVGEILIRQGGADNDVFFVLSGVFRVFVNGREIGVRQAGQHLGEMVIVDPSARRTATVVASEPSVVAQVEETAFLALANKHPRIWQRVALQLCRRLDDRKKFHSIPNAKPILFVGTSKEHLELGQALVAGLPDALVSTRIWSQGVFGASSFPVDDLEAQIRIADFAVLVAGPDDRVTSRGVESDAPRDNVIFELGFFMGALSRLRTFLLVPRGRKLKIPTDLLGLNCLQFDASATIAAEAVKTAVSELVELITRMSVK